MSKGFVDSGFERGLVVADVAAFGSPGFVEPIEGSGFEHEFASAIHDSRRINYVVPCQSTHCNPATRENSLTFRVTSVAR
jgi:hypothetical protein